MICTIKGEEGTMKLRDDWSNCVCTRYHAVITYVIN